MVKPESVFDELVEKLIEVATDYGQSECARADVDEAKKNLLDEINALRKDRDDWKELATR